MPPGRQLQSLSEVEYEDIVQEVIDKHGIDFLKLRAARRSLGPVLEARMEIASRLKIVGVVARNVGRILNCDEWMVRYYANPNHRKRKRRGDMERYYAKNRADIGNQAKEQRLLDAVA